MTASGTIQDISVDDQRIRLEIHGVGPTIILLHGWSLDRRMWHPQVEALSENYRVVLMDRRGFGQSLAPPNLEKERDDILAVQQALGISSCALIGMSQGGRIALRFAHKYPNKLWALVLMGAPLDGFPSQPGKMDRIPIDLYRSLVKSGDIQEMKKLWAAHPLMKSDDPTTQHLVQNMLQDYQVRDLLYPLTASSTRPPQIAQSLDQIRIPTLIINGARDTPWLLLVAKALDHGLPNSTRLIIPEAGHLANISHSPIVNQALAAFLDRHRTMVPDDNITL